MKYVVFEDMINSDSLSDFINDVNETEDDITLFMTTGGGSANKSDIITNIINNDDKIKKVVFIWENSSAGFDILMNVRKPKKMINCISVAHISSRDLDFRDTLNNSKWQNFLLNDLKNNNKELLKKYREYGLNEEQLKRLENGKDVYLLQEEIENLKGWNK